MAIVNNFFELDNGKTREILEKLVQGVYVPEMNEQIALGEDYDPDNARYWSGNPFSLISNNDKLWAAYVWVSGRVTLTSFFQNLAICQFFVMDNKKGPEGDSAKQMLRKHWYAWGKLALQPAAVRLGVGLMENGTPDSEKLYDLMSRTLGDWNEDGKLEYRQVWVENNSTQFKIIENTLPAPYDSILICCEKDAAFNGVVTSAVAMGALAVYSGGGKSSRSGIEKLYYAALQNKIRNGNTLYVLVISDWDTDGESVIAPTFVDQLRTYIPEHQIRWTRVGIKPEQVEEFGYDLPDKEYAVKWNVGGQLNYLEWCRDHALFHYSCQSCGHQDVKVGAICPECGEVMLPQDNERPEAKAKANMEWYKEQFVKFYEENTPGGLELDALTRIDYCKLLVQGLTELVGIEDIFGALSDEAQPERWYPLNNIKRFILENNESFQEATNYKDKLQSWFDRRVRDLDDTLTEINRALEEKINEWLEEAKEDDRLKEEDPESDGDRLTEYMQGVRQATGRCQQCYTSTDRCYDPARHRAAGYWSEPTDLFAGIGRFQPFSAERRGSLWEAVVREDHTDEIQDLIDVRHDYPEVQGINLDDNPND